MERGLEWVQLLTSAFFPVVCSPGSAHGCTTTAPASLPRISSSLHFFPSFFSVCLWEFCACSNLMYHSLFFLLFLSLWWREDGRKGKNGGCGDAGR